MPIEQYRRHGTFNDRQSVYHAALGIDVLKKTVYWTAWPPIRGR